MNITQQQKELTQRRTALALQVEIPSMAEYAVKWQKLGADFDAIGWKNNASICYSNAARYGAMDEDEYMRLLERVPVRLERKNDLRECFSCGTYTKHVSLASPDGIFLGWMCGCGEFLPATSIEKEQLINVQTP